MMRDLMHHLYLAFGLAFAFAFGSGTRTAGTAGPVVPDEDLPHFTLLY